MTSAEKWVALGTICLLILIMAAGARAWQKDIDLLEKMTLVNERCIRTADVMMDKLTPMSHPLPNTILNPAPRCWKKGKRKKCERV
ncbi:MAG: hypothetical protein A2W25_15135 [candidate division Zixibacteria bacterium RBG_16_53_22]|nr:MAG: hypothetical protein A2W25_15135 [candidate division Zixibacteria bacterium RBG_16_53_22]